MKNKEFSRIRKSLGGTQSQIARILCVSPKAVQSFEQGWRNIPTHIEREMLLLLSLKQSVNKDRTPRPCWIIKNCPEDWRENCLVWRLQVAHFCWYINGTFCQGKIHRDWAEKIKICKECEIFQAMLSTKLPRS
jgi:DNA-binding XRE family transcriptional regulator